MKYAFPENLRTVLYPTEFRRQTVTETRRLSEIVLEHWPCVMGVVGESGPFKDMFVYQLGLRLTNRTGRYLFAPDDLGTFDPDLPTTGWYYLSGLGLLDPRWHQNVAVILQRSLTGRSSVFLDMNTSDLEAAVGQQMATRILPHFMMYSFQFSQPKTIKKV